MPTVIADTARIQLGDFLQLSPDWPQPVAIVCDGPYGLSSYEGDLRDPRNLTEWYQPFIQRFTQAASPQTTLWFWNTELGWAYVHPLIEQHGWIFHSANIWDKGIAHIAGNSNTQTLRSFPVVSEVCVQYVRPPVFFRADGSEISLQEWLRAEWLRTGLPLNEANAACGVKNAATRKYLTACEHWYMPPPAVFQSMVDYANRHGDPGGRPYFKDSQGLDRPAYEQMRAKFACPAGITNVWRHPTVPHQRRTTVRHSSHPNEKPVPLIERIVTASTDPGDVVWDPFSGVGTTAVACIYSKRRCYASEIHPPYWQASQRRLANLQRRLL